jgi:hypothetical protein
MDARESSAHEAVISQDALRTYDRNAHSNPPCDCIHPGAHVESGAEQALNNLLCSSTRPNRSRRRDFVGNSHVLRTS